MVELDKWKPYFDGTTNVYGHNIGAVLILSEGNQFQASAWLTFPYTNNIVEYEACIMGLRMAIDMEVETLEVFGDSLLIIFQKWWEFKTKDPKLELYPQ